MDPSQQRRRRWTARGRECRRGPNRCGSAARGAVEAGERHLRLRTGIDKRAKPTSEQARGANHHGGGGLGQPPADAIEASALRARPRWRGRSAPSACGRPPPSVSQASRPQLPDCVIGSPIESLDSDGGGDWPHSERQEIRGVHRAGKTIRGNDYCLCTDEPRIVCGPAESENESRKPLQGQTAVCTLLIAHYSVD